MVSADKKKVLVRLAQIIYSSYPMPDSTKGCPEKRGRITVCIGCSFPACSLPSPCLLLENWLWVGGCPFDTPPLPRAFSLPPILQLRVSQCSCKLCKNNSPALFGLNDMSLCVLSITRVPVSPAKMFKSSGRREILQCRGMNDQVECETQGGKGGMSVQVRLVIQHPALERMPAACYTCHVPVHICNVCCCPLEIYSLPSRSDVANF